MDRYTSQIVVCQGGLDTSTEALQLGTTNTGYATILQNMEPSTVGGYRRINGYSKFDSSEVTGEADSPILGVKVARDGVFAGRLNDAETAIDIYFSSGTGWGSALTANVTNLSTSTSKLRFISYFQAGTETVVALTGLNPAWRYDGTSDSSINGVGAPSAPKYGTFFKERLVLAPSTNASSFALSESGDDDDFDGASGALEFNVGDKIVGLKAFRDNLYIFCEDSIFKLVGNTSSDFAIQPVTQSIGCLSQDTIQEVGGDLIFLAPDGLRSIAATERIGDIELGKLSAKIESEFDNILGILGEDSFSSCVIRAKSQYRLFFRESLADEESRGILGKLSSDGSNTGYEWATLVGIPVYSSDSEYNAEDEVSVFGHLTDGNVYRMERGDSFDGSNIAAVYESPQLTLEDATIRKVLRKIDIYSKVEGTSEPTLKMLFDFNNADVKQPRSIQLTTSGDVSRYGTAVYGTDMYSISTTPVFKKNLIGSGFTVAINISSNGQLSPYTIDSFQVQYTPKGRR